MWYYEKKLQYPVKVSTCNPTLAKYLIEQYGGADGSRTRVQKILTNHKSHSYLTGFVYTVLSLLFTIYKSQEQVLMLKLSTQEPIRINLFVRQSLLS